MKIKINKIIIITTTYITPDSDWNGNQKRKEKSHTKKEEKKKRKKKKKKKEKKTGAKKSKAQEKGQTLLGRFIPQSNQNRKKEACTD